MNKQDFIIKVDGTHTECQPTDKEHYTLEEMQSIVGGYIEVVASTEDKVMIGNEDGAFLFPINAEATRWVIDNCGFAVRIYGDVLVCDRERA